MKTMFRMCGRDDQQGAIATNYMLDTLKAKRIAVIHDKDTYGRAGGRRQGGDEQARSQRSAV